MNSLDLLIVTRRFWPHCGLTEFATSDLAQNLRDSGHNVTIATVRWSKSWSENVSFHGIPVVRFARPVTGPWTAFRYARSLAKHFSAKSYDGVIVSGVGDEAAAVIRSVDELTPVILRVDDSYSGVVDQLHRKHIENCLSADAVIANSGPVADSLSQLEAMPVVTVVHDGLRCGNKEIPSDGERVRIRSALSNAHPILKIRPDQPLVVSCTRMNSDCGLIDLVNAWPEVLHRFPAARLWLIGDGKRGSKIWQRIVKLDLVHSIVMPGYFDDLDEVLAAADLYVHAANGSQTGEGLFRAMSVGLPVITSDTGWISTFVNPGINGDLVTEGCPSELADAILERIQDSSARQFMGTQAILTVERQFSPRQQVEKYLELLSIPSHEMVAASR